MNGNFLFNLTAFTDGLKIAGGVVLAVVMLLVMVTVHEFGHYVAGKILGFKINEFSVGFGPAIFKRRSKKSGELFALRVVPLGGYCAFDGEDDGETAENFPQEPFEETQEEKKEQTPEKEPSDEYPEPKGVKFNDQKPWKRIIVLLAGATMNYLLALVLLLIMVGSYGVPMCIALPVGYTDGMAVERTEWESETLGDRDIIVGMNGEKIKMPTDIIDALEGKKAGEEITVTVLRYKDEKAGWQERKVSHMLLADAKFKNMADVEKIKDVVGFEIYTTALKRGFFETVGGAFDYSLQMGGSIFKTLGQLLTGKLGVNSLGGPVTTISQTAQAATVSAFSFLYISAFIGVNLAVFNLLPIPALDGSKIVFCIIEWIRKKPVNRNVENWLHFIGIILLFGFAILVDLLQLFN